MIRPANLIWSYSYTLINDPQKILKMYMSIFFCFYSLIRILIADSFYIKFLLWTLIKNNWLFQSLSNLWNGKVFFESLGGKNCQPD